MTITVERPSDPPSDLPWVSRDSRTVVGARGRDVGEGVGFVETSCPGRPVAGGTSGEKRVSLKCGDLRRRVLTTGSGTTTDGITLGSGLPVEPGSGVFLTDLGSVRTTVLSSLSPRNDLCRFMSGLSTSTGPVSGLTVTRGEGCRRTRSGVVSGERGLGDGRGGRGPQDLGVVVLRDRADWDLEGVQALLLPYLEGVEGPWTYSLPRPCPSFPWYLRV